MNWFFGKFLLGVADVAVGDWGERSQELPESETGAQ